MCVWWGVGGGLPGEGSAAAGGASAALLQPDPDYRLRSVGKKRGLEKKEKGAFPKRFGVKVRPLRVGRSDWRLRLASQSKVISGIAGGGVCVCLRNIGRTTIRGLRTFTWGWRWGLPRTW